MRFITIPDMPKSPVTSLLLAGNVPELRRELETQYHLEILSLPKGRGIHSSVGWHADILCHYAGEGRIFVSPQVDLSEKNGYRVIKISREPQEPYPKDILLNAARVGDRLFCNVENTAEEILQDCEKRGICVCPVRQGYSKCSVIVVEEQAIITADPSIAKAAYRQKMDVLQITPGNVELEGFSYGFLGGCTGKLAPDQMAFTGEIATHPDGENIRAFLRNYGIFPVALHKGALRDIGGILPLTEVGF